MTTLKENVLHTDRIAIIEPPANKKQLFEKLSILFHKTDDSLKPAVILQNLLQREKLGSTAIGHQFAIPHARMESIDAPVLACMNLTDNFQYDDKNQVKFIFCLLVPTEADNAHLNLLSTFAKHCQSLEFRKKLLACQQPNQIYQYLKSIL